MTTDDTVTALGHRRADSAPSSDLDPIVSDVLKGQPTAVLELLAEAVVIHDRDGRWVYANPAAASLFGFESVVQMLATPTAQVLSRFVAHHEDGTPLKDEQRPGRRLLAGQSASPITVRVVDRETGRQSWRRTKATAAYDADGIPRLAINVIEDISIIKQAELAQRLLARASETLLSTLDPEQALAHLANSAVPDLADWCTVEIVDPDGQLCSVAVAHPDPEKAAFARDHARRNPASAHDAGVRTLVVRSGKTQVHNKITEAFLKERIPNDERRAVVRTLGISAVMVVPLVASDAVLGTITLMNAESERTFCDADRELAEELARRAGAALQNARLHAERSQIAKTLQASLSPAVLPEMPGVQIASLCRPGGGHDSVGGDFYDAVQGPSGWLVFLGDVTGRGVKAATLTAHARFTLRSLARVVPDPRDILALLNQSLLEQSGYLPCTVVLVLLKTVGDELLATSICAGHPQPLLIRGGKVASVGTPGLLLGAFQEVAWTSTTTPLRRGDVLVLITDGVTDNLGDHGRLGEDRARAALQGARDAPDAIARLDAKLRDFQIGPRPDDATAMALHFHGTIETNQAGVISRSLSGVSRFGDISVDATVVPDPERFAEPVLEHFACTRLG
jgi:PAS domain S-box-containing protein